MVGETFARGLRSVERRDGMALVQLRVESAVLPGLVEAAFPGRLSFTLSPGGDASIVLPDGELDAGLAALPQAARIHVHRGLTSISASGVCMSGAENKARHICAALSRAGIPLRSLSLCDLAAAITVDEPDADQAFEIVCEAVPLVF